MTIHWQFLVISMVKCSSLQSRLRSPLPYPSYASDCWGYFSNPIIIGKLGVACCVMSTFKCGWVWGRQLCVIYFIIIWHLLFLSRLFLMFKSKVKLEYYFCKIYKWSRHSHSIWLSSRLTALHVLFILSHWSEITLFTQP